MQQHLLHQHLARVFHAQGNHGQAVAHQHHVHARVLGHVRRREVVRRDHGDLLALLVHALQRAERHLFARGGGREAHGGVGGVVAGLDMLMGVRLMLGLGLLKGDDDGGGEEGCTCTTK